MTASPRLLRLFALAAWTAGSLALAGQEKPGAPAPAVPIFGSEVQVIALPVFVADKSGQAVPDLTAADFEIEDGGKRAEIVGFQVVDAGASLDQPSPARSVTMDAASRRQFLLLFDFAFGTAAGLHKARAGAIDFITRGLAPRDLAAVATLGPSGPNLVVGFTGDKDQLGQAVSRLGMARGERLTDPLALAYDLNFKVQETQMGLVFESEEEREQVVQLMRSDREAYSKRVGAYVAGLDSLAAMLNAVQGRKQVLLFSAGFDQSLIGGSQGAERFESSRAVTEGRLWEVQSDSYFGDAAARGGLEQLFRRLGASDAVVHTVDIGGLAAGADVADATRTPMGRGRDTLAHLASGSGGMFLKEVNDVAGALRDVTDASRYFYVLGFAPVREGKAGRFRKLSVKVKRPGLRASHRVGYVVPDPKAPEPATMARLSAGEAIAKGLSGGAFGLEALAVPMSGASEGAPRLLAVALRVDGRGVLNGVSDDALGLEVYAYALDAEGRIVDALSTTPSLDLRKLRDGLQEHGLLLLTVFKAPAGAADLRFFVRHPASARAASLRILAEAPPAAWPVSAPLLMADPATRIVMPVASRANPELELPFRVGPRAFAPEVSPVLVNGKAAEVCVMARPPRGSSLEVIADLRAADGKTTSLETSGPMRLSKDQDGAFRIVLNLTPKDIPAGDYALRVTLRDEAGEEVFAEQPVGVR